MSKPSSSLGQLPVDGILLLNKPQGLTSNVALQKVKRLLGAQKAGHTGTLDPMATGMLPLCFGDATKFSRYLLEEEKIYRATGVFGQQTDTGDVTGQVTQTTNRTEIQREDLERVLQSFLGESMQVPPMYSALKHQGKALYHYARDGVVIERPARRIHIDHIQLLALEGATFKIRAQVSKGTYIRTLIEDIATRLGTLATMSALHREHTSGFAQEPMMTLEALEALTIEERSACLLPMERAVAQLESLVLNQDHIKHLYHGVVLTDLTDLTPHAFYALYDEHHQFMGVGESVTERQLKSTRLRRGS